MVKFEVYVSDLDGMSGVIAALKADDHVHVFGEKVADLTLAFVSPLGAQ
jgi:hypothetical protein